MATENDLVLIYFEEQPFVFARIESILADSKPDWYHVKLLLLQVPLATVTWILRDGYINGESFTMDGKKLRLERVVAPGDSPAEDAPEKPVSSGPNRLQKPAGTKVISFSDRKKT